MKTLLTIIIGFGLIFISLTGHTNDTAAAQPPMFTRALVVTESFVSRLQHLVAPKTGESNQDLLLRYFKTQHIEINKPATLTLDEKNKRLTVHATGIDLIKIEAVVSKLQEES